MQHFIMSVLRPVITAYEKQINLDKYINKKTRKERATKAGKKGKSVAQSTQPNTVTSDQISAEVSKPAIEDSSIVNAVVTLPDSKKEDNSISHSSQTLHATENVSSENCLKPSQVEGNEASSESNCLDADIKKSTEQSSSSSQPSGDKSSASQQRKRPRSPGIDSSHEDAKRSCLDATCALDNSEVHIGNATDADILLNQDNGERLFRGVYDNSWESCFISKTETLTPESLVSNISVNKSDNDSQDESSGNKASVKLLPLPNIANTDMVVLEPPDPHLLPENVSVSEEEELQNYDVERYYTMVCALFLTI